MTWLNRGFKIRHKIEKEKDMKAEAIKALELFKQQHLARPAVDASDEQADIVSESSQPTKENQMEQRNLGELLASWEDGEKSKKNINYPDHIAPLKQRIMSALKNGARSVESVARYCKEEEKLINLQLNRWVSRGMIGKHITPSSGIVRYYPEDIAREMGILTAPQPINRKGKKVKEQKRSSSVQTTEIQKAINAHPQKPTATQEAQYIEFLEKRIVEWQTEARKMANQIISLEKEVIKAKTEPRNVTGEVEEVMQEVRELRATVAYLESKLFGSK